MSELSGEKLRKWSDTQQRHEVELLDDVAAKTRELVSTLLPRLRAEALTNPKQRGAEASMLLEFNFKGVPEVAVSAAPVPPVVRSCRTS
jgi:hypothetical protein